MIGLTIKPVSYKTAKTLFILFNVILYTCFLFISILCFIAVLYLLFCYMESKTPPSSFDLIASSQGTAGKNYTIYITNIYRRKLCPFKRNIQVIDSSNRVYNYEQDVNIPMKLGHDTDLDYVLILDKDLAPGPARINFMALYTCPGNLIEVWWPVQVVKQVKFNVIP